MVLLLIALVGCRGAAATGSPRTEAAPTPDTPAPDSSSPATNGASSTSPEPWRTGSLVDVRSGAELHLADYGGKVLFVESVATWCPPCVEQQAEARTALARLDPARVVWISLDVDPAEDGAALLRYANRHDYTWTFAVGSPELLRYLAGRFGDRVLLVPDTPVIVVAPDGTATLTEYGIKRAERLVELARERGA